MLCVEEDLDEPRERGRLGQRPEAARVDPGERLDVGVPVPRARARPLNVKVEVRAKWPLGRESGKQAVVGHVREWRGVVALRRQPLELG